MGVAAKARADCWDAALTEAQRWQAYDRMRRAPWHAVSAWIGEELKAPPPSRSALYRWAARMRRDESAHKVEQAILARDEIGALAQAAGQEDAHLIEAFKALAVDLVMTTGDAKAAARYTDMALKLSADASKRAELELKRRAQETRDEALRLAREKFEAAEKRLAEARQVVTNEALTDEERTARMREIFGV